MYKVLLVDDEPLMIKGLTTMTPWQKYGCEICALAYDGEEGINMIKKHSPNIVFTDIKMFDVSGLDMIALMQDKLKKSKIIIITGYRDFEYAQAALELGVFGFITKPFKIERIEQILKKAVNELDLMHQNEAQIKHIQETFNKNLKMQNSMLEISEELNIAVKTNNLQQIEKIKEIIKALCDETHNHKYSKIIYKYLIYTLLDIHKKLLGEEFNSSSFEVSNIDRMISDSTKKEDIYYLINKIIDNIIKRLDFQQQVQADNRINDMISYINDHYNEPISLKNIALNACVSYHYASKLFKSATKKSFIEYLNGVRIEKAKELCSDYRYRGNDIARMVGIENAYYFSSLFKKYTGMTVTEYRKKILKK